MKKAVLFLLPIFLFASCLFAGCGCAKKGKERTRYEINAEYKPSDSTLTGTVKVDFYNAYDTEFTCLQFQLYPNAYRKGALLSPIGYDVALESYYAGESYGEIGISSALGASGFEVGGADKNLLFVYLEKPLAPEKRVTVDIGFSTRLAKVNHRLGITKTAVNFAGAFPVLCGYTQSGFYECVPSDVGDAYYADAAEYTLHLTTPKEYTLVSGGRVLEERTLESKKRYTVSAMNARDLAFCMAKDYAFLQEKTGKTTVEYAYYQAKNSEEIIAFAQKAIAFYSSVFGEYPYDVLRLAQTSLTHGQADGSGLCMIPEKWTAQGELAGETAFELAKLIAGEWWYSAVGANRMEHPWLVDGLSAYSAALFFGKHDGYGVTKQEIIEKARTEYNAFRDGYQKALGWVDTRMSRQLSSFLNSYEYENVVEHKSVVMFAELEKALGSKKFLSGLRKYYAENLFENAMPAHLVGAYERIGLDLHGFFDGYVNGKGTF